MEVVFHGGSMEVVESKLGYFPAISLLFRTAGRTAGWADGRPARRPAGEINTKANSAQLSWDLG
jgi:hypothetical protein